MAAIYTCHFFSALLHSVVSLFCVCLFGGQDNGMYMHLSGIYHVTLNPFLIPSNNRNH